MISIDKKRNAKTEPSGRESTGGGSLRRFSDEIFYFAPPAVT